MPHYRDARAMLPASDFERAKSWYADKLGLKPIEEMGDQGAYYEVGPTRFLLYPSQFAGTNQGTAMGLNVDDVPSTVEELRTNGIEFEEYDFPGLKTENGIATLGEGDEQFQTAWFKDSEGNIIAVGNS